MEPNTFCAETYGESAAIFHQQTAEDSLFTIQTATYKPLTQDFTEITSDHYSTGQPLLSKWV